MVSLLLAASALLVALSLLGAVGVAASRAFAIIRADLRTAQVPAEGSYLLEMAAKVAALKIEVERLPSIYESEVKRAERAWNAARAVESKSRQRAEAIAAAEAGTEDSDVREYDADGSGSEGVLPMFQGMGGSTSDDIRRKATALGY